MPGRQWHCGVGGEWARDGAAAGWARYAVSQLHDALMIAYVVRRGKCLLVMAARVSIPSQAGTKGIAPEQAGSRAMRRHGGAGAIGSSASLGRRLWHPRSKEAGETFNDPHPHPG